MSRSLFTQDTETFFNQLEKPKHFDWRDRLVKNIPPIWSTLMMALAVTAFFGDVIDLFIAR